MPQGIAANFAHRARQPHFHVEIVLTQKPRGGKGIAIDLLAGAVAGHGDGTLRQPHHGGEAAVRR